MKLGYEKRVCWLLFVYIYAKSNKTADTHNYLETSGDEMTRTAIQKTKIMDASKSRKPECFQTTGNQSLKVLGHLAITS